MPICRRLFKQDVCLDVSFARDNAGRSIPARMAIIAITTSSSINVNPLRGREGGSWEKGSATVISVFMSRLIMEYCSLALFELVDRETFTKHSFLIFYEHY